MSYRIGCDVGGTFTDLCLFEEKSGKAIFVKTPTTTGHQATGVIEATRTALKLAGINPRKLSGFSHGTTVATNAILERNGARTAFLVTEGFRDILIIGRQTRSHLYDQRSRKPEPLVPRDRIFEISERIAADGTVRKPLDESQIEGIVEKLRAEKVETLAVTLLHSYANDAHERRIAKLLASLAPEIKVSISCDVLAEPGEYERASTTVMNAYLMPPLANYLSRILETLEADGVLAEPAIMQSGGGVMPIETASGEKAVHTCLSGPAAGMIGARRFAEAAGYRNVVTIDMGGTSFDIGLIHDGEVLTRHTSEVEGIPLRVPMFDIITLGAGGGSIAAIDPGGLLKVGPESAGARPGPAAYGKGGTRPTVTDANVVLGRLRAGRSLGGGITVDREKAAAAIKQHIADPLSISVEAAAIGILQVVNAEMVRGMRRVTVERGLDPRDFAAMAFGGAGPLHAIDLCAELGIGAVIIPPSPGLLCGIGLLLAPWQHEETAMVGRIRDEVADAALFGQIETMRQRIFARARRDRIDIETLDTVASAELRYHGQGYQISIALGDDGIDGAVASFHAAHRKAFGYDRPMEKVDIHLIRVKATAPAPAETLPVPEFEHGENEIIGSSTMWIGDGMIDVPVYERRRLLPGTSLQGPLIVEQQDTTLVVGRQRLTVDNFGNLIIGMQS